MINRTSFFFNIYPPSQSPTSTTSPNHLRRKRLHQIIHAKPATKDHHQSEESASKASTPMHPRQAIHQEVPHQAIHQRSPPVRTICVESVYTNASMPSHPPRSTAPSHPPKNTAPSHPVEVIPVGGYRRYDRVAAPLPARRFFFLQLLFLQAMMTATSQLFLW